MRAAFTFTEPSEVHLCLAARRIQVLEKRLREWGNSTSRRGILRPNDLLRFLEATRSCMKDQLDAKKDLESGIVTLCSQTMPFFPRVAMLSGRDGSYSYEWHRSHSSNRNESLMLEAC